MANSDNPRGLTVARQGGATAQTGAVNKYYIPASDGTAAYIGGLVKLAGSADADGVPSVTANVSAADAVVGVITAFEFVTRDSTTYREASTERYALVADDPLQVFEVQEDSVGGALAATNVGQNANLTGFTSGQTSTGRSSIEIDSSTAATTATLDVQILRLVQRDDNEIGTNAKWLVRLNNHQFVDGTTGV